MKDEDLRDLFAGLALIGLNTSIRDEKHTAAWCYKIADAMIEAKYAEDEPEEPEEVGIAAVVKRTRKKHGTDS